MFKYSPLNKCSHGENNFTSFKKLNKSCYPQIFFNDIIYIYYIYIVQAIFTKSEHFGSEFVLMKVKATNHFSNHNRCINRAILWKTKLCILVTHLALIIMTDCWLLSLQSSRGGQSLHKFPLHHQRNLNPSASKFNRISFS